MSHRLVDPELHGLLQETPRLLISEETLPEVRKQWLTPEPTDVVAPTGSVDLTVLRIKGPERAPDVEIRVYQPALPHSPSGCILHMHGGGYIGGDPASLEPVHRSLSYRLHCVLVTVNYRVAPETRFPGAIEDCYAALKWVFDHVVDLRINPNLIGLMGESAGGGLAAALALLARDRGEFPLAFQHLIYPMLDDRTCVIAEPVPHTGEFAWTAQNNGFGWAALLGAVPGSDGVSQYAAAARAKTLVGLPATYISVGGLDLFLGENIEYAQRLIRAGVPVELHVYPGAFHGFDSHPTAKVSCAARRDGFAALARFLTRYSQL